VRDCLEPAKQTASHKPWGVGAFRNQENTSSLTLATSMRHPSVSLPGPEAAREVEWLDRFGRC
jgi:hypothetical protein